MKRLIHFICLLLISTSLWANEVAPLSKNEQAIHTMVKDWAQAWQNQAIDEYLSFYSPEFIPANGLSLAQWQQQRRERVSEPLFIKTETNDIDITELRGAFAQVQFRQKYTAAKYQDQVMKALHLERLHGKWLIVKESSKPIKIK
ncbi:nuclear transport factor 2 family protein [Deefgea tanakiae]|jgi:murein L,D-transpeptidase YafK|uniref:Nuclear transport factor 2 family protein n=1 Tax=Deefgea tanakiae TaxID=2865840 RepID=A0ABX8Z9Q1_9NEIS|nr:nuclear transport factor 2 family protein [Deefgea tanakiae]QZA77880.1 nuclear transport factor 2 family protein [Deefgea tanakiae]